MRKLNQNGFTLVEGLLIVIAVAIIAFVGYYVWNTQKESDKNLKVYKPASFAKETEKSNEAKNYLTITEWGVRGKIDSAITPKYNITGDINQVWAQLSSGELIAADAKCDVEGQAGGVIIRAKGTDHSYNQAGDDLGTTIQQDIGSGALKGYKKVGGYYYWLDRGQAPCGDAKEATQALQSKTQDAFEEAVSKFEAIPAQ